MKKNYYLMLVVLLLTSAVKAQTGWATQKLDEKVAVKFPEAPTKKTINNFDVYAYKGKDSVAYTATIIDFQVVAHLDSAALAPMKDSQEFADQMKLGMATSKPTFTFGNVAIGKWNNYTTYNVSATENNKKSNLTILMILIGSKVYSISCLVPANLATKNNEVFLASAQLIKK